MASTIYKIAAAVVALALAANAIAQEQEPVERSTGPLIEHYGPVFEVPNAQNPAEIMLGVKAAFDVSEVAITPQDVNRRIETVARYMNMHAANGVPVERIEAAVVIHGGATRATLSNAAYRQRFGSDNPNLPMLKALTDAGVEIYLCGQSAASRGFGRAEISELVKVSLSAMTAHVQLQSQGYALIPF